MELSSNLLWKSCVASLGLLWKKYAKLLVLASISLLCVSKSQISYCCLRMSRGMVRMGRRPTTTRLCQPVFAGSRNTDYVSITNRHLICIMCTQAHSCWRTMDGKRLQWKGWLVLSARGQGLEGVWCFVCVCLRKRVILSPSHFFLYPACSCICPFIRAVTLVFAIEWDHDCVYKEVNTHCFGYDWRISCCLLKETSLVIFWKGSRNLLIYFNFQAGIW